MSEPAAGSWPRRGLGAKRAAVSMFSILAHLSELCCDGGKLETSFGLYARREKRVVVAVIPNSPSMSLELPRYGVGVQDTVPRSWRGAS